MSRLLGLIQNFQKLDYMDLKIIGSPTIVDGVFSGFSSSNYLQLQQAIPNLDVNSFFEIELKVTMPETITRQQILGSNNTNYSGNATYDIGFQVYDDNRLLAHCYNSTTDERYNIFVTSSSALNGKVCYIKYTITNSRMTVSLSFDKISWESNYYALPTTFSYTRASYSIFGWGKANSAFTGSIDLNNSYIIIDGTKYFLRLPNLINLITVGSPTITGTVVSNFSDNDYLKISNTNFSFDRNIDLYFKIHTDQINDDQSIFSSIQKPTGITEYDCFISLNAVNKYGFNSIRKNNHQLFQQAELNFNNDVDIYFHFSWNYNTKLFKFGYSYDGTNYSYPISINDGYSYYKLISDIYIGKSIINGSYGSLNAFAGSIDLDETKTYAIIDNKKYTFKLS